MLVHQPNIGKVFRTDIYYYSDNLFISKVSYIKKKQGLMILLHREKVKICRNQFTPVRSQEDSYNLISFST